MEIGAASLAMQVCNKPVHPPYHLGLPAGQLARLPAC